MSRYKYEIGDTVSYKALKTKDITCPCCGHIETEFKSVQRWGKIESRGKDYTVSSWDMGYQLDKEEQPDGTILIIPSIGNIEQPVKENFYKINNQSVLEEAILGQRNEN
ncbi:hypothetical protein LCGC14_0431410 [marine sediment metagenome]|uniref:Uncharacterized protein n=1 Tax=marine sediment metagenome TaxID=412755 RepID=A0A0F9VA76_9ZZZZ